MPLVFVHGVNVRLDQNYQTAVNARDEMFRAHLLTAISKDWPKSSILNPYWGRYGGKFAWNFASSPRRATETLGAAEHLASALAAQFAGTPSTGTALLELARTEGLPSALDTLFLCAAEGLQHASMQEVARLGRDLYTWSLTNSRPAWLLEVANDIQLIQRLSLEAEPAASPQRSQEERLGGRGDQFHTLREALDRLAFAVPALVSGGVAYHLRRASRHVIENFTGDILAYLDGRKAGANPGEIVTTVLQSLERAAKEATSTGAPLIVVAHSMGGNIVYDILSYFRPDLPVDLLVTVGSQTGVFAELRRFLISTSDVPGQGGDKLPALSHVKRWLNIFDHKDLLGFAAEEIFNGVRDYAYDTGRGLLASHTRYFQRLSFHHFLSERAAQRD
jgi:hypothetical protein